MKEILFEMFGKQEHADCYAFTVGSIIRGIIWLPVMIVVLIFTKRFIIKKGRK